MRVALISPLNKKTGIARYSCTLASALLEGGVDVTLFCEDLNNRETYLDSKGIMDNVDITTLENAEELRNYDIIHFQLGDSVYHHFQNHLLSNIKEMKTKKIATVHDPQINRCFTLMCKRCCYQIFLNASQVLKSIPSALSGAIDNHRLYCQFPHESMNLIWSQNMDGLIFHSKCCKKYFESRTKFFATPTIIRSIGYLNEFNDKIESNGENLLLFIPNIVLGRFRGIDFIIDVLKELPIEYKTIITGRPIYSSKKLMRMCKSYGLEDKISFVGILEYKNFLQQFRDCSIVLIPRRVSKGEVSANMIHAMCAGKPIIASKLGSFPEYLKSCGILCDAKSIGAWKDAIMKLASDEQLRFELGNRARKFAEMELSKAKIAKEHMKFYHEILRDN